MRDNRKKMSGEETVRMWKEEYEKITVPAETRECVMAGIRQARVEKKRRDHMKYAKRTGLTAAAAVVTFGLAVNASPVVANAMEGIPVIGSIAKVVTFRTFEDSQKGMIADVEIPQVGGNANVNADIQKYADELIAKYEAEVASAVGEGHYALESSYKVVSDTPDYVSIQINTVETQASGAEYVKIFTVNKVTGEAVSLADFLKDADTLAAVSDNIVEQMQEQMKADESKTYFIGDEPGSFTGLTGDENFYVNESGSLVIVFGEYEVAPGYMGVVSFEIPDAVSGLNA